MIELRDYQEDAIRDYQEREREVLAEVEAGDREIPTGLVIGAPTGSGKTVMAWRIMMEEMINDRRAMFVVDRLALMRQTSKAFNNFGLFHHVVHDKNWNLDPQFLPMALVASSQTIEAKLRGKKSKGDMERLLESCDLIIVDEAHSVRHFMKVVAKMGKRVLGLTATPLNTDMLDYYDPNVINTVTTKKLTEQGHLSEARVYIAKDKDRFDMSGAATVGGEWTKDTCEERGVDIIGNIVDNWIERCKYLNLQDPKTIVFGPTVAYCNWLVEVWQGLGYKFEVLSYKEHPDICAERIERFSNGDVRGLVSCEKISKGFDVADVQILVSARPYKKSVQSHIQQFGRLIRPCPDIDMKYVFDHTGNYQRFMAETRTIHTSGVKKIPKKGDKIEGGPAPTKVCPACGCLLMLAATSCPECGHVFESREVTQSDGPVVWEELQLSDDFKVRERQKDYAVRLKTSNELQEWFSLCSLANELLPMHYDEHKKTSWCLAQFKAVHDRWPRELGRPFPFFPDMGVRLPEFERRVRKNYEHFLELMDVSRGTFRGPEDFGPPEGHPANMSSDGPPPIEDDYGNYSHRRYH